MNGTFLRSLLVAGVLVFVGSLVLLNLTKFNFSSKNPLMISNTNKRALTPAISTLSALQPPMLGSHHKLSQIPSLSKDLIVHSSYFDSRPRNGHNNVTVLFVNVNRTILDNKWILGCGGNNVRATSYEVYSIFENVLMHYWLGPKPVIYENEMILCYDLPVKNGSSVYAAYKPSANSSFELLSYSRQPLFFPAPKVKPKEGDDFTVVVCSKLYNIHAPWIKEFIQYQRTLGVDHIEFSVLDSFIKDDGYDKRVLNDPVVRDALRDGFINFSVWPETYEKNGEAYNHSENLRKLACIYRYIGTYDYVMPLDTDDFFNPVGPSKKLKDYIRQYCYTEPAASCRFDWVRFYPDFGHDGNIGPEGNVTAHLNVKKNTFQKNFKSVHSTKAIRDASFHDARCPECLAPGYKMISIPQSVAYVAHIRFGSHKTLQRQLCHFFQVLIGTKSFTC